MLSNTISNKLTRGKIKIPQNLDNPKDRSTLNRFGKSTHISLQLCYTSAELYQHRNRRKLNADIKEHFARAPILPRQVPMSPHREPISSYQMALNNVLRVFHDVLLVVHILLVVHDVSQCFTSVSWCFTMFNNALCLASRTTIGIADRVGRWPPIA